MQACPTVVPLPSAASRGHEIIVKRLLEYGCPVDIEVGRSVVLL